MSVLISACAQAMLFAVPMPEPERVTKPSVVAYDPDMQACAQMNDEEVSGKSWSVAILANSNLFAWLWGPQATTAVAALIQEPVSLCSSCCRYSQHGMAVIGIQARLPHPSDLPRHWDLSLR
jgi:hypothetical protein